MLKLKPLQCKGTFKFCVLAGPSLPGLLEPEAWERTAEVWGIDVWMRPGAHRHAGESAEPHPAPAGVCAAGLAHPGSSAKSAWPHTRSGHSSADYLASSDLNNVLHDAESKAKTHSSCFLLVSDLAGPSLRQRHWKPHNGEFSPCGPSCVLLQAATLPRLLLILILQSLYWIFSLNPCLDCCRFF